MSPEDRIKIAEFIGLEPLREDWAECEPKGKAAMWFYPSKNLPARSLPDPENSADDDCLVLEAMREKAQTDQKFWHEYVAAMRDFPAIAYKVSYQKGDYSRALLKVLESE